MKTYAVLVISMVAQVAGNLLLSKGMKQIAASVSVGPGYWPLFFQQMIETPSVWLGVLLLILFFALYAVLLSWADLSFVVPASSFGYVLNVALAHHFLMEPVSLVRWAGTALVSMGVVLVSMTRTRSFKFEHSPADRRGVADQ